MTNINLSAGSDSLANILSGSFDLLKERPVLFLPRLVSTAISTAWFYGILKNIGNPIYYVVSLPLLNLLGLFVLVMLAGMVKNSEADNILKAGFMEALSRFKSIIFSTIALFLVAIIFSLPLTLGMIYYRLNGNILFLVVGATVTLVLSLVLTFLGYFFPMTLLEKDSVIKGFKESKGFASSHSKEVATLTFFSFLLLGIAFLSQGVLELIGFIGFAFGRFISAIITTYVFVVSPKFYLEK